VAQVELMRYEKPQYDQAEARAAADADGGGGRAAEGGIALGFDGGSSDARKGGSGGGVGGCSALSKSCKGAVSGVAAARLPCAVLFASPAALGTTAESGNPTRSIACWHRSRRNVFFNIGSVVSTSRT
jgi:hypothetical protein